jgi:uncharacterized protein (TIGR02271 family)
VAFADEYLDPGLKPMSEVNDYKIEKGDPDPRGYTVVGSDGRSIGTVDDLIIDTAAMKVRYLVVDVTASGRASEQPILLPAQDVDVRSDSRQVIARRFTGQERRWTRPAASGREREQTRLTRAEEELEIGKREVERGEARFGKHVETEHVSQPVTKKREEVVVERRPVTAGARADASISEDEVRVPLKEEELVVEKRPVVKEELVVGKREVEERDTVEADLRREEFDLDKESTARPRGPRREDF